MSGTQNRSVPSKTISNRSGEKEPPSAPGRRTRSVHKEGRKLNGAYCIITVHEMSDGNLNYRAYNARTSEDVCVTLSQAEVAAVVTTCKAENATPSVQHKHVIDSLGFEDRMFSIDDGTISVQGSKTVNQEKDSSGTDDDMPEAEEVKVSSKSSNGVGNGGEGGSMRRSLYKEGRKINGAYHIITIREEEEEDDLEPVVLLRAYNPMTSRVSEQELQVVDFRRLLRLPADAPLVAAWEAEVARVREAKRTGHLSEERGTFTALWSRVVQEVVVQRLERQASARHVEGDRKAVKEVLPPPPPPVTAPVVPLAAVLEGTSRCGVPEVHAVATTSESEHASETLLEAESAGDEAAMQADWKAAATAFGRAVGRSDGLSHALRVGQKHAAALLAAQQFDECVAACKRLVTTGRKLQGHARRAATGSATLDPDAASVAITVSAGVVAAYRCMGEAYMKQRRVPRAANALTLALKEEEQQLPLPTPPPLSDVAEETRPQTVSTKELLRRVLTLQQTGGVQQAGPQGQQPPEVDVEEVASGTVLMKLNDKLKFGCTMCGECCRSADHIMLSPHDLWLMTRSTAMVEADAGSTQKLRAHSRFGPALKYTLKDGLPVCFLRPAKSSTGQCHFAYPLFKRGEGDVGDGGDTLSPQEAEERGLGTYVPVTASEYNLTEEEEEEALRRLRDGVEDEEEEEEVEESEEEEDEQESEEVEEAEPIMNSFGRQALGCVLGMNAMPAMCASYPLARELSWADFWHVDEEDEAAAAAGSVALHPLRSRVASANQKQGCGTGTGKGGCGGSCDCGDGQGQVEVQHSLTDHRFVVVKTNGCEAFYPDGQPRTTVVLDAAAVASADGVSSSVKSNGESVAAGSAVDPQPGVTPERTLAEFLGGESGVAVRWKEQDWFMRLMLEAGSVVPAEQGGVPPALGRLATSGLLRRRFVEQLARIWFNFDTLSAARTRPFRSWARVQAAVVTSTRALLRATNEFVDRNLEDGKGTEAGEAVQLVEDAFKGGKSEEEVVREYMELISRMRL